MCEHLIMFNILLYWQLKMMIVTDLESVQNYYINLNRNMCLHIEYLNILLYK